MSELINERVALLDEFINFQDTNNIAKIQKLKKKIQKFLKLSQISDIQLLDAVKVLNVWVEDHEYNDFDQCHRIALPVVDRLAKLDYWDYYDVWLANYVVSFGIDYKATHEFAKKTLTALEEYKNNKRYDGQKLNICLSVLLRLLRAKYFETNYTNPDVDLSELAALFYDYFNQCIELCEKHEKYKLYKILASIRKGLFEQDYPAVEQGLRNIKKSAPDFYKITTEEVNGYGAFAGSSMTKMQLNIQIGNNIRKLRRSNYMSIGDLSEKAGVTYTTLQAIEKGRLSIAAFNLKRLADAFKVPIDELVNGNGGHATEMDEPPSELVELIRTVKTLPTSTVELLHNMAKEFAEALYK